jgi:hypothetical protein
MYNWCQRVYSNLDGLTRVSNQHNGRPSSIPDNRLGSSCSSRSSTFEPAKDRLHSSKLYHSLASAGQPTLEPRCPRKPDPQSSYSRRSRKPENIVIVVVTAQDRTRQAPANDIERTTSHNQASRSARVYPRRRCRLEVADENIPAVSHPPTSEAGIASIKPSPLSWTCT